MSFLRINLVHGSSAPIYKLSCVDVDFRQLVNRIPKGASFTIISDSCHSGGLIDKEKEQIGPSSATRTGTTTKTLSTKPKIIPYETVLAHLAASTRINTSDVGTHLRHSFGDDASLRFRLPWHELQLFAQLKPDEGILLSGCQANETSADMSPAEGGGKAYGAFSNAVQIVLHENHSPLSNRELVVLARKVLEAQKFEQHPCLYCSDENANATFLLQPRT